MSFSKSTSKRFVEPVPIGPPVGRYDVTKAETKSSGSVIFEKGARFKDKKEQTPGPADTQSLVLTERNLNVSGLSDVSFATPSYTPLKRKNRIMSSSASDVTSKDEIMKRVRHLEYETNELEKRLQRMNNEKEDMTKTIKQLTKERDDQILQLQSMQQEAEDIYSKRELLLKDEHQQICDSMQSTIEKKEEDLYGLQNKLKDQETICDELRTNVNGLTQQLESVNKENNSLNDNIFNLEKSVELLEIQISNLTSELSKTRNEKADLEEQIECLENTTTENLRCLTLKFEGLEVEHENMIKEFREKETILNSELELTKMSANNIEEDYETMKNAYKVLRGDYTAVVSEADDLTEKCKETEKQLAVAEEKYQSVSQKLEDQTLETEKEKTKLECELEKVTLALKTKESEVSAQSEAIESLRRINEDQAKDQETLFRRIDRLSHQNEEYELEIQKLKEEHKSEMYVKDEMIIKIKEELGRRIVDTQTKLSTAEHAFKSKLENQEEQYNLLLEENERLRTSSGLDGLKSEVVLWRNKFEELQSKIKPFQSQLEQFENERLVLLSENSTKESELAKLAERYAQILGHQNNKQKIHHVIKIKEENLMLKKEVTKLRTQIAREKNSNKQGSPKMSRKSKFDRTKAFQHSGKENQVP